MDFFVIKLTVFPGGCTPERMRDLDVTCELLDWSSLCSWGKEVGDDLSGTQEYI